MIGFPDYAGALLVKAAEIRVLPFKFGSNRFALFLQTLPKTLASIINHGPLPFNAVFSRRFTRRDDAFVETVVASFSYAVEIRAQIIEDLDELIGFLQREEEDDEEAYRGDDRAHRAHVWSQA